MPMRRRFGRSAEDTVKLNGKTYVLAKMGGKAVYSTSTRAIEGTLNDDDRIVIDRFDGPLGKNPAKIDNCSNVLPGRLGLAGALTTVTGVTIDTRPRHWFEEKDANGTWYAYGVTPTDVIKIEYGFPPVIRLQGTIGGGASRVYGQPAKMLSSAGGSRWFVPNDDLSDIGGIDAFRLDVVGIGAAADSWTGVNIDATGAAHFQQMPGGKVAMIAAQFSGLNFQNKCQMRMLTRGAVAETAANWGGPFEVGSQSHYATGMASWDDLAVVFKQDGAFAAFERSDNTIEFRNLLPDAKSIFTASPRDAPVVKGVVWHGKLIAPTKENIWRHNLASAKPVGPDAEPENIWNNPGLGNGATPRLGTGASFDVGGGWIYTPYVAGIGSTLILAGRETRPGDETTAEMLWTQIAPEAVGAACDSLIVSRNMTNPRLLWVERTGVNTGVVKQVLLAGDQGPYPEFGGYGAINSSGTFYGREYEFPARALFREARYEIESPTTGLTWNLAVSVDGGVITAIGTGIGTTGSIFWTPGTNDVARRARFRFGWATDGTYNPNASPTCRLRKVTIEFKHLPDKSDAIMFVVDLRRTALRRRVSQQQVRNELNALRDATVPVVTWTDPLGATGFIVIDDTSEEAPEKAGGALGSEILTVRGALNEYS